MFYGPEDAYPPPGHVQTLYCDVCKKPLRLVYNAFDEEVSGIRVRITGLPCLHCDECPADYLPDNSRFAIVHLHERAIQGGHKSLTSTRKKPNKRYGFTKVDFDYDSDDYEYLPGLTRPWDSGFLTPVFFNRTVLHKYDSLPGYGVHFASATYGSVDAPGWDISFGINKTGKVIMWLGDIAKLPLNEQHYLRSENVPSDHDIGSEFYDGQIDVQFTPPTKEQELFGLRSKFLETASKFFGTKFAHLACTRFRRHQVRCFGLPLFP